MGIELTVLVLAASVLMSLWATTKVIADEFSGRWQKGLQLALVWCVPLIGALLVLGVHRSAEKPSGRYRKDADAGDDFGASSAGIRRTLDALDDD